MHPSSRFALLHGPYRAPRCRIGGYLECAIRGRVQVRAMSDGRIQWPMTQRRTGGGKRFLILCGDLVRAIQQESATAVCYWWGVTPQTVTVWRKALGVPQHNAGTLDLHRRWMPDRIDEETRERAHEAARSPEARAKIAAAKKGKRRPRHVIEAMRKGRLGKKHSAAARRKMSKAYRQRYEQLRQQGAAFGDRRLFTPEEDALLGTDLDRVIAERIGHNLKSVAKRRKLLGIPSFREQHGYEACRDR